jgi:Ras-related protein Rab-1A
MTDESEMENSERTIKIIILGSSEVGKTCILNRYFHNEFKENLLSTIGIDFNTKFFKFENHKIKANYIDTAGQEKFRAISINYLKGTDGVILVFDLTNKETFDLLETWIKEFENTNKSDVSKVLIGNKSDLEEQRQVTTEDAVNFAKTLNCKYYEASAKTGKNVNEALDEIARTAFTNITNNEERVDSIVLDGNLKKNKGKKCC